MFEARAVEFENIASVTAIGGNLARSRPLFIWQLDTDGLTTANNTSIIDPDTNPWCEMWIQSLSNPWHLKMLNRIYNVVTSE